MTSLRLLVLISLCSPCWASMVLYTSDAEQLRSATDGATVVLSGDIEADGEIVIRAANVTVVGLGHTVTQAKEDSRTIVLSGDGCSLSGVRFVGYGKERPWKSGATTGNNVAGVYVESCQDTTIRDCQFTNHAGGSIVLNGPCDGTTIDHCKIVGCGSPAIAHGDNGADGGIKGTANSVAKRQITITRCNISGHCFGMLIPGDCSMIVSDNHVHDIPGQHAMYFTRGGDSVVRGNIVSDCSMNGIKFQHQTRGDIAPVLNISGNTVVRCGNAGIGVFATTAEMGTIRNVLVSSNNITACDEFGVYLRHCVDAAVMTNRISECPIGMYLRESSGMFTPNAVVSCHTKYKLEQVESVLDAAK